MEYLPLSFLAGVLTILAPCVLPTLPVIVGGSVSEGKDYWRPYLITGSLAASLLLFALLLKASTSLLFIDPMVWRILSGIILIFLGIITVWPELWEKISVALGLSASTGKLLHSSAQHQGWVRSVLIGFALGPVFSSCSPTFLVVISVILPQHFWLGLLNLVVYVLGVTVVMLLLAIGGQAAIAKTKWAANPHGWFRRSLGVLFIIIGLMIMLSWDKALSVYLLENHLPTFSNVEQQFLDKIQR